MNGVNPDLLLKLSLQRALLGEITANMAAVTTSIQDYTISVVFQFFDPPLESEKESVSSIATDVIANFPDGYVIDAVTSIISNRKAEPNQTWIFLRKEASPGV